jgi:polygalacturonase
MNFANAHVFDQQTNAIKIEDIQYINIHGTSSSSIAVKFNCGAANPCTRIFLQDINLVQASSGEATISSCSNAYGSFTGTMTPPSCLNMD